MPIYEYRCQSCSHTEEIFQKVNDPAPEGCSFCGKKGEMEKLVSSTSFTLKGSGWYKDLYASPKTNTDSSTKSDTTKKSSD